MQHLAAIALPLERFVSKQRECICGREARSRALLCATAPLISRKDTCFMHGCRPWSMKGLSDFEFVIKTAWLESGLSSQVWHESTPFARPTPTHSVGSDDATGYLEVRFLKAPLEPDGSMQQ